MSFSSQVNGSLAGASSIFAFFFSEKFVSQHFQDVELDQGDPQPGDLYVFQLQSSKTQRCGAHVGVYCGRGEIIHLEKCFENVMALTLRCWINVLFLLAIILLAATVCTLH
uniref:cDNA sequence BC048679 n=1 Tax=Cricetulus griseus TaxID=10029 RepID=A0A8C2QE79_CRIGR